MQPTLAATVLLPLDASVADDRTTRPAPACPPSATAWPVALAGFVVVAAGLYLAARFDLDPAISALLIMVAGFCPAVLFDGAPKTVRAWRDGPREFSLARVAIKLVGLVAAFFLAGGAIAVFPFFQQEEFSALFALTPAVVAALAPIVILYIALVDGLAREKEDGLYALGALLIGHVYDLRALNNFLLAQAIKLFFFSLMLRYFALDIAFFRDNPAPLSPFGSLDDFQWFNRLIFALDVALAGLGYIATFKLFGWDVREAEPTGLGWAACLICYEPFFPAFERAFVNYHGPENSGAWLNGTLVGSVWITVILVSNFVYLLATAAFGPLFSNLTRRAIITSGPYRFTKHPAYVSKNFGWWLTELPSFFEGSFDDTIRRAIMLGCISAIYVVRARCEERLLAQDPAYCAYAEYIAKRGIAAMLVRAAANALRGA
jgi:protein-S-isoprenylcysteine O-methyltransferase Ste14